MAGSLYIWFMGAGFLLVAGVVGALVLMLRIGHWAEKSETGAKHGFLELPEHSRSVPLPTAPAPPASGDAPSEPLKEP